MPPGSPTYWLDLFTGTTWDEFRAAGARVTGFRETQAKHARKVKPGDVFLCYLTGVMRWVGALEVVGPSKDRRAIWKDEGFPVRFEVRPQVMCEAECGVPMENLLGRVSFYATSADRPGFQGFLRRSPAQFRNAEDSAQVLRLLHEAAATPVRRPVDHRKLARKPRFQAAIKKGKRTVKTWVTVPEAETTAERDARPSIDDAQARGASTQHTEIQHHLLALGAELGLDVWVARNDRSKAWNGATLGSMPAIVDQLPTQFSEVTQRTIELIDVLWLRGKSIVAAFEVECTTSIYSGLLRMSDLLALQPNLDIRLFIVAPEERRDRVEQEIGRPTFAALEKPLHRVCGFLGFCALMEKIEGARKLGITGSLKHDFLEKVAEYFSNDDEEDDDE
jgi:hypothetical protein